jgi:hypothetical protein
MNENENSFESLRRILAFKNRETPPPGYFNGFSAQVVARIRAGETNESSVAWFSKLLQAFEFKPAFAGSFAGALCMLLVFGIVYAQRPDAAPQPLLTSSTQVSSPLAMTSPTDFIPQTGSSGLMVSSNNSVLNLGSVASLFNQPNQNQLGQQVSFTVPGN